MTILRTAQPFARPGKVPPIPEASTRTRTFRLEDATPADWLLCRELGEDGTVIPNAPVVKVAKAWELQRTRQDFETNGRRLDSVGRKHEFDTSLLQVVTRGSITETWVIVPAFALGDQIQAEQVTYSGAFDGTTAITLMDNSPGRAWAILD